jgi:hypothetical protein
MGSRYDSEVNFHDSNWFPRIFSQLWSDESGCPTASLSTPDLIFRWVYFH